jgi:type IV pilus assembly protein PilM
VTNINILLSGNFAFMRDISIGGNRYTETIQKELGVSHEEAEKAKKGMPSGAEDEIAGGGVEGLDKDALNAVVETVSGEIASEIVRSFGYFRTTTGHEQIDRVLLCGGSAKLPLLVSFLQEKLEIPVEMADPFRKIAIDPTMFDMDYIREIAPMAAVPVGLGIRKLGDR